MKKLISMVLVLVLIASMVLTGCGSSNEDATSDNASTSKTTSDTKDDTKTDSDDDASVATTSGKVTFPLEEQITLTCFVHTKPTVDDFENNDFTKMIEEATNINLDFIVASSNEADDRLSLLFATGDYPDLILTTQLTYDEQALYGGQGTLLPLNDYINDYDVINEVFTAYPLAKQMVTQLDGNIYNLPYVNDIANTATIRKMFVYQPWLDALGLDAPETIDDFYDMLVAFKTQDPNGNGIADEIPLAGSYKGWGTQVQQYILGSYINSSNGQLFVDNDTVKAQYTQDGWKEAMKFIQKCVDEGLIAKESFTQAADGLKTMTENPDTVIVGAFPGGYQGSGTNLAGERWKDYLPIAPVEGPEGLRYSEHNTNGQFLPGFSVTDSCENPAVAVALADLLYTRDFTMTNIFGPENVGWKYNDDDSKEGFIDGEKAIYEKLLPLEEQGANTYWKMGNIYTSDELFRGGYSTGENNIDKMTYEASKFFYLPYVAPEETKMPPVKYTTAQSEELQLYAVTLQDYIDETIGTWVTTDTDIDAAWDDHLATLEAIGLTRFLEIQQEAYDAFKLLY